MNEEIQIARNDTIQRELFPDPLERAILAGTSSARNAIRLGKFRRLYKLRSNVRRRPPDELARCTYRTDWWNQAKAATSQMPEPVPRPFDLAFQDPTKHAGVSPARFEWDAYWKAKRARNMCRQNVRFAIAPTGDWGQGRIDLAAKSLQEQIDSAMERGLLFRCRYYLRLRYDGRYPWMMMVNFYAVRPSWMVSNKGWSRATHVLDAAFRQLLI